MDVGPTGPYGDAEADGNPTLEDILATVEWSINTGNVEMADFIFDDNGETGGYFQLLGSHYNLTRLSEDRLDTVQDILDEWVMEGEDPIPVTTSSPRR